MAGRHRKILSVEQLEHDIDAYFDDCDSNVKIYEDKKGRQQIILRPYTWLGLCKWLNITRVNLNKYFNRIDSEGNSYHDTLTYAKDRIEQFQVENAMTGLLNERMVALNLTTNYGYARREITKTVNEEINMREQLHLLSDEELDRRRIELENKMGINRNVIDVEPKKVK